MAPGRPNVEHWHPTPLGNRAEGPTPRGAGAQHLPSTMEAVVHVGHVAWPTRGLCLRMGQEPTTGWLPSELVVHRC